MRTPERAKWTQSATERVLGSNDHATHYVTTSRRRKFKPLGLFDGLGDGFEDVGDDLGDAFDKAEKAGKGFSLTWGLFRAVDKLLKPIKDIGKIVKNVGLLVENANLTIVEVQEDTDLILEDMKPFVDKLDPMIDSLQELLEAVKVWAPRVGAVVGVVLLTQWVSLVVHILSMLA